MKFTYKLFFSITALLTAAFMLFGSFMLFSYFNRMENERTFSFRPFMIWCIRTWKNTERNLLGYRQEIPQQNG